MRGCASKSFPHAMPIPICIEGDYSGEVKENDPKRKG
jgi:hypothetical protein